MLLFVPVTYSLEVVCIYCWNATANLLPVISEGNLKLVMVGVCMLQKLITARSQAIFLFQRAGC